MDSPEENRNGCEESRVGHSYIAMDEWENNLDTLEQPCRMHNWEPGQHDLLFVIAQARELIRKCEYHAATMLLEPYINHFSSPQKITKGLQGAQQRLTLFLKEAASSFSITGVPGTQRLQNFSNDDLYLCAEVLLTMQVYADRHDYGPMMLRMTPLLCKLSELVLNKNGIDTKKIFTTDKQQRMFLNWKLLQREYPDIYSNSSVQYKAEQCFQKNRCEELISTEVLLPLI